MRETTETRFKYQRLYADNCGESYFDMQEFAMTLQDFAPPAPPLNASPPQPAFRFVVVQLPVAWGGDAPHPAPSRQMVFCLAGTFRVTASDGETRTFGPGDALLLADTNGKGHITEVTSPHPVTAVMVRLE